VASVFIETHEAPERAPSDSENMIPFNELEGVVETLLEFDRLAKSRPISLGES
jgi:2-dehydro-3-deoxyphosphooctonate aldolase (KDO 8-P synthase)